MKTVGISIGSTNIKLVLLADGKKSVLKIAAHDGNIPFHLEKLFDEIDIKGGVKAVVTGAEGRHQLKIKNIIEPVAIESAISAFGIKADAVVSIGGEDLVIYTLADGRIVNTLSGNKCASGTGEFFRQQLGRMDMTLEDIASVAEEGRICKLSARCSVFMKSDCTHRLNKGEAEKGDIVRSLSYVMAGKVYEFLSRAKIDTGNVLLIGGVTNNRIFIAALKTLYGDKIKFTVMPESPFFEAYGAAVLAEKEGDEINTDEKKLKELGLFRESVVSYPQLPRLRDAEKYITKLPSSRGKISKDAEYVLGIDGGSTTTKVVLMDIKTNEICGEYYGRTHGNPVEALKNCLVELKKQVESVLGPGGKVKITLASTTGSSREILGVYAETRAVYNEIIAHSVGISFFYKDVDTIFEIGGQDAKYVFLKNLVPIDYAMNEACSAGTGSFLEESAKGDLNINEAKDIGIIALKAETPLKFGEHCSAFINSDIRKAIQQGATREDITAGIVYSIVSNYLNRVVGNRNIGSNIVLQGGVAKNVAVPLAFASILNKNILIPPDPELMGSFGVALLAKKKEAEGLLEKGSYDIDELIANKIEYGKEFKCSTCANLCPIRTIKVNEHQYFFGGRCNKYANIRKKVGLDIEKIENYVDYREKLIFEKYSPDFSRLDKISVKSIGIPRAFSVYNLWPLYSWFFHNLGFRAVLSDQVLEEGMKKCESAFCYPGEIAHGALMDLLRNKKVDYYFIPHFKDMPSYEDNVHACLCPIVQGLPYYLRVAFDLKPEQLLAPIFSFKNGFEEEEDEFVKMAETLGRTKKEGKAAYADALEKFRAFTHEYLQKGKEVIEAHKNDEKPVIVLQGRPYNAFAIEANMGIPRKFTSRGYTIIPFDMIPISDEESVPNMYWYYGQQNMKTARIVKESKNFFLCYVSNFSCAPDSFILHFIRWMMGMKPFLVLELDSHSADAGIDTRIEAFLDIIDGYLKNIDSITDKPKKKKYRVVFGDRKAWVEDLATREKIGFKDKRINFVFPSMGRMATEAITAVTKSQGINAIHLPVPDEMTIMIARDLASGKECIPTLLVLGLIVQYLNKIKYSNDDEGIYLFLVPYTTGPCRTGQYAHFYEKTFENMGYENVLFLTLNSDNSYTELGSGFSLAAWYAVILSDYFKDIETGLKTLAVDKEKALAIFEEAWQEILTALEKGKNYVLPALKPAVEKIKAIPLDGNPKDLPKVLIVGEIYVRRDDYSVTELLSYLIKNRVIGKITGLSEWIYYTEYDRKYRLKEYFKERGIFKTVYSKALRDYLVIKVEEWYKHHIEHKLGSVMRETNLIPEYPHNMKQIMKHAETFFTHELSSEATISASVAYQAMQEGYSGIVVISPFACLPGRLIKSVLDPLFRKSGFPFIALENDGSKYPPNLINRLEIFILNVLRFRKPTITGK